MATPQSLNRYSYCLNNPLLYIDPSGYTVVIPLPDQLANLSDEAFSMLAENPTALGEWGLLVDAYHRLENNAPELISTLEGAKETVEIIFNRSLPEGMIGLTSKAYNYDSTHNMIISLRYESDANILACTISHEGFHAAEFLGGRFPGKNKNYSSNEAFAYAFEYAVSLKLGCEEYYSDKSAGHFRKLSPFLPDREINRLVKEGGQFLMVNGYPTAPWYSQFTGQIYPMPNWPPSGRARFLDVARSVWIH
jgi:hypothetical protein